MHRASRYTGVAAILTVWTALLAAAAVGGLDVLGPAPLSYLGGRSGSGALFTVGLLSSALLLTVFHQHLRNRYPVSPGFSLTMITGLAGQVVAAVVPIGGDPAAHRIHTAAALVLGVSLPGLMWRFAAGQQPGPWRKRAYRLFWLEVVACAAGLYLSARGIAPVAEILPASIFHLWIVAVTFMPSRRGHLGVQPHYPASLKQAIDLPHAEWKAKPVPEPAIVTQSAAGAHRTAGTGLAAYFLLLAGPRTTCYRRLGLGQRGTARRRPKHGEEGLFQLCPRGPGLGHLRSQEHRCRRFPGRV